jgi:hypothetical protein
MLGKAIRNNEISSNGTIWNRVRQCLAYTGGVVMLGRAVTATEI